MTSGFALEEFLASDEAQAVAAASEVERREIAKRLHDALADVGRTLVELDAGDVHGWLLHAVPERFEPGDSLAPHVAPVLRGLVKFAARTSGKKLIELRADVDETLPDLEHALEHGHHHHGHDHGHDHEAPAPYVRESPKVGRNDPCPCGSGKKFKKCHGA